MGKSVGNQIKTAVNLRWVILLKSRQANEDNTVVYRGRLNAELSKIWGCSSAGRAPALQAGGQEFDPPHLHQSAGKALEKKFLFEEKKLYLENWTMKNLKRW